MGESGARRRPAVITVICCLGFIGAAFSALNLFTALAGRPRSPFHAYYSAVTAVSLAGFIGMWRMKKWGVLLYALTAAANAVLLWRVWGFPPAGVLVGASVAAAVVAAGLSQFRRMD